MTKVIINNLLLEGIGWTATAVFAGSYFCKQPKTLRRLQALSALLWISYGLIIQAMPVVAANVTVAFLAIYTSSRQKKDYEINENNETTEG